jgi:hypothetical protein
MKEWLAGLSVSDIDWGSAPAWVTALVSGLVGLIALRALAYTRRANEISEQALEETRQQRRDLQAIEEFRATETSTAPEPVSWAVEHVRKQLYVLRHTGTSKAFGVTLDTERTQGIVKRPPENVDVDPGAATPEFLIVPTAQLPTTTEVWVTWVGGPGPVAVPVPAQ